MTGVAKSPFVTICHTLLDEEPAVRDRPGRSDCLNGVAGAGAVADNEDQLHAVVVGGELHRRLRRQRRPRLLVRSEEDHELSSSRQRPSQGQGPSLVPRLSVHFRCQRRHRHLGEEDELIFIQRQVHFNVAAGGDIIAACQRHIAAAVKAAEQAHLGCVLHRNSLNHHLFRDRGGRRNEHLACTKGHLGAVLRNIGVETLGRIINTNLLQRKRVAASHPSQLQRLQIPR